MPKPHAILCKSMGKYAVATLLLILLVLQAPLFSLFPCSDCRRIALEKPTPTPSPPPSRPSPPSPHPSPKPHPSPPRSSPKPHPSPPRPSPKPHPPSSSPAPAPSPPKKSPSPAPAPSPPKKSPTPAPAPSPPKKSPTPAPAPSPPKKCPINALKLGLCVDILDGLVHIGIGKKAKEACCPVIKWMIGLDAAVCLCTAISLKLMDVNLLLPITLQLLADCGKRLPSSYKCPCIGEDCS